jgi:HSP20 family protein
MHRSVVVLFAAAWGFPTVRTGGQGGSLPKIGVTRQVSGFALVRSTRICHRCRLGGCFVRPSHPLWTVSRKIRTIRLRLLEGQIGEVAYQITKVHFSKFHETGIQWRPPINVFQCASCFRICVELAGVEPNQIEIDVELGRILIRGYREAPEPLQQQEMALSATRKPVRVVAMEINHGQFEREVEIPPGYDQRRITTEWENGLLWIFLPRIAHA